MSEVEQFKVIAEEIEKPYTMVKIAHTSNGVTYTARGWALWDGQGEYREWEGVNIALTRARRKIAARLAWEARLSQEAECAADTHRKAITASIAAAVALKDVRVLHRDGGTVNL